MDRVIVVTGTRKGLGKGIAEHYLAKGDRVFGCSRGASSIDHPAYRHFEVDVADEPAVVDMVRAVAKDAGRIDALVNNAGIASMNHITLTPHSKVTEIFQTNFFGSFLFLREVSKVMIRKKAGRIINFTTVATPLNLEGEAIYAASKASVESLTRIAAREMGQYGITVNALGPTPVPTDLIKNVPQAKMDALLQRQAIRRFGSLEDVLNVIDFFMSDSSEFITGQVLYLGGVTS